MYAIRSYYATGGDGSYTYALSGPVTGSNDNGVFSSLEDGHYTVLITDGNSCTYTVDFDITEPELLGAVLSSKSNVSCNGGSDGLIEISVTGGTAPYTISSSPALTFTGNTAVGVSAGTYTISVSDDNGCSVTSFRITSYNVCYTKLLRIGTGRKRLYSFVKYADI